MEMSVYEQNDEYDAIEKEFEGRTMFFMNEIPELPELTIKTGIAFTGKCIVRGKPNDFFGGNCSRHYESDVMDSPTWDDLFKCAIDQQKMTNDFHHDYFEGFSEIWNEIINDEAVTVLELHLGS